MLYTISLPQLKPPYSALLNRPVCFRTRQDNGHEAAESGLVTNENGGLMAARPAAGSQVFLNAGADGNLWVQLERQFKSRGGFLSAIRRADENPAAFATVGQMVAQPLRHLARLFLAAWGEPALGIGLAWLGVFGFGVAPEYEVHGAELITSS